MKKMICFDMDGTIADLYGVDNWHSKLRSEDASPYAEAAPMCDMEKVNDVLRMLQAAGWEIRVITWLSKNSSEEYKDAVRAAKRAWLEKWGFVYDHFHGVQYGATKADSVRGKADYAILIDDSDKVRNGWHLGPAVNPTENDILSFLLGLVDEEK